MHWGGGFYSHTKAAFAWLQECVESQRLEQNYYSPPKEWRQILLRVAEWERRVCLYCFVRVTLHLPQCGLWTKRWGIHKNMYTWDVLSQTHTRPLYICMRLREKQNGLKIVWIAYSQSVHTWCSHQNVITFHAASIKVVSVPESKGRLCRITGVLRTLHIVVSNSR
jgi:hypothetical protein